MIDDTVASLIEKRIDIDAILLQIKGIIDKASLAVQAVLREKGLLPEVKFAMGLSLGEVTALTAAGVFDFQTGLKIVAERGRLMQQACEKSVGGMAAIIGEERAKVSELCQAFDLETANFNAPGQIIVSGDKAKVDAAVAAVALGLRG